mmetsp:Transcript_14540/g.43962  ORF Transcript_14540/g.43962 Transcript_14540/m.43962 type:complete len:293 (+) Transcript_14540:608-1486(+)
MDRRRLYSRLALPVHPRCPLSRQRQHRPPLERLHPPRTGSSNLRRRHLSISRAPPRRHLLASSPHTLPTSSRTRSPMTHSLISRSSSISHTHRSSRAGVTNHRAPRSSRGSSRAISINSSSRGSSSSSSSRPPRSSSGRSPEDIHCTHHSGSSTSRGRLRPRHLSHRSSGIISSTTSTSTSRSKLLCRRSNHINHTSLPRHPVRHSQLLYRHRSPLFRHWPPLPWAHSLQRQTMRQTRQQAAWQVVVLQRGQTKLRHPGAVCQRPRLQRLRKTPWRPWRSLSGWLGNGRLPG